MREANAQKEVAQKKTPDRTIALMLRIPESQCCEGFRGKLNYRSPAIIEIQENGFSIAPTVLWELIGITFSNILEKDCKRHANLSTFERRTNRASHIAQS